MHKHLIGPRGETIAQIINSFTGQGPIAVDIPRKSSSALWSDTISVTCHKSSVSQAQSQIDESLRMFLFPKEKGLLVSTLFSNGLETYVILDLKDFKRIGGKNGEKLVGLTRKYAACIFIEKVLADSVTLRVVGQSKTDSEKLKQHLLVSSAFFKQFRERRKLQPL